MLLFFAQEFFTDAYVLDICTEGLFLIMILSAPMLMSALSVGLVVAVLQATTSVQEQTLAFVPKIVATFLSMVVCGTWMLGMIGGYASRLYTDIANMGPGGG